MFYTEDEIRDFLNDKVDPENPIDCKQLARDLLGANIVSDHLLQKLSIAQQALYTLKRLNPSPEQSSTIDSSIDRMDAISSPTRGPKTIDL